MPIEPIKLNSVGVTNCLKTHDGREFMAYIFQHFDFPNDLCWDLLERLDGECHKGTLEMLTENFLKGQPNE